MARHEQVVPVFPELERRFDLSYAVRAGNTLYLSGLLSVDDQFVLVGEGDMEAQIRCIYARLQRVLAAATGVRVVGLAHPGALLEVHATAVLDRVL